MLNAEDTHQWTKGLLVSGQSDREMGEVNNLIGRRHPLMMIKKRTPFSYTCCQHMSDDDHFLSGIQDMCQHTAGQHMSDDDHFLEGQTATHGSR